MDPEDSYLSWLFHLRTKAGRDAIAEVFEFVNEDCDLTIELEDEEAETGAEQAGDTRRDGAPSSQAEKQPGAASANAPGAEKADSGKDGGARGASSIRVDLSRVDRLVNVVGELVITQAMFAEQIAQQGGNMRQNWTQGQEDLAAHTRELQECVMAIRMQPVRSVFARMPRLVRDVAAKLNKKVRLVTSGDQTEVDKTVVEELADPLTHMIRNAIDHGIESPEVRAANGKPEEGTIELSASQRAGNILIQIADDGAGINRERLLRKAIEKGIVPPDANLSDGEIDELIFAPGFSTAEKVTDTSGRGVGMDVVRRNISNLGGRIQIQSTPGKGTRFTLVLPLTLAVLDGMLVAVGNEKYIVPLTSIVESIRPDQNQVRPIGGGAQVISIRGEFIRLIPLHRIFNVPTTVTEPWKGLVVVVEQEKGSKIGVLVDELIGQQQVVVKSLAENFDPVRGISGATILGNGRVALILDVEALVAMPEKALLNGADEDAGSLAEALDAAVDMASMQLPAHAPAHSRNLAAAH
jgi:two-component system chemotaxis sensor kinase CheA